MEQVAAFLGIPASDDVIRAVVEKSEFKNMQKREAAGEVLPDVKKEPNMAVVSGQRFIRKGLVGDWKNYFTSEQNQRVEVQLKAMLEKCPGLEVTFE